MSLFFILLQIRNRCVSVCLSHMCSVEGLLYPRGARFQWHSIMCQSCFWKSFWTLLEHQQYLPSREGSQLEQLLVFLIVPQKGSTLGSEELELAQSVQVLPGDLTPTFSHVSWSGCLWGFQARKWAWGGLSSANGVHIDRVFYAPDAFWKFVSVFCKFNRILKKLEGAVISWSSNLPLFLSTEGSFCHANIFYSWAGILSWLSLNETHLCGANCGAYRQPFQW